MSSEKIHSRAKKKITEVTIGSEMTQRRLRLVLIREPHKRRGDNLFPRCALIRGMHETSNPDWWDACVRGR